MGWRECFLPNLKTKLNEVEQFPYINTLKQISFTQYESGCISILFFSRSQIPFSLSFLSLSSCCSIGPQLHLFLKGLQYRNSTLLKQNLGLDTEEGDPAHSAEIISLGRWALRSGSFSRTPGSSFCVMEVVTSPLQAAEASERGCHFSSELNAASSMTSQANGNCWVLRHRDLYLRSLSAQRPCNFALRESCQFRIRKNFLKIRTTSHQIDCFTE